MHDQVIVGLGKLNPQHMCEGYSSRLFVCVCVCICMCLCVSVCVCAQKANNNRKALKCVLTLCAYSKGVDKGWLAGGLKAAHFS